MNTEDKRNLIVEQIDLQNEIVAMAKINIVNCGNCGSVFLHRTDDSDNVICPFCYENMAKSDCPDYFFKGLELSGEFEFNNKHILSKQVEFREITDVICPKTNLPIFAKEEAYFLDENWYHNSADIDNVIKEICGENETADSVYQDDGDFYYFTTYHDVEDIVEAIVDNGYYFNKQGNKVYTDFDLEHKQDFINDNYKF